MVHESVSEETYSSYSSSITEMLEAVGSTQHTSTAAKAITTNPISTQLTETRSTITKSISFPNKNGNEKKRNAFSLLMSSANKKSHNSSISQFPTIAMTKKRTERLTIAVPRTSLLEKDLDTIDDTFKGREEEEEDDDNIKVKKTATITTTSNNKNYSKSNCTIKKKNDIYTNGKYCSVDREKSEVYDSTETLNKIVYCPAGCGQSLPLKNINIHLDYHCHTLVHCDQPPTSFATSLTVIPCDSKTVTTSAFASATVDSFPSYDSFLPSTRQCTSSRTTVSSTATISQDNFDSNECSLITEPYHDDKSFVCNRNHNNCYEINVNKAVGTTYQSSGTVSQRFEKIGEKCVVTTNSSIYSCSSPTKLTTKVDDCKKIDMSMVDITAPMNDFNVGLKQSSMEKYSSKLKDDSDCRDENQRHVIIIHDSDEEINPSVEHANVTSTLTTTTTEKIFLAKHDNRPNIEICGAHDTTNDTNDNYLNDSCSTFDGNPFLRNDMAATSRINNQFSKQNNCCDAKNGNNDDDTTCDTIQTPRLPQHLNNPCEVGDNSVTIEKLPFVEKIDNIHNDNIHYNDNIDNDVKTTAVKMLNSVPKGKDDDCCKNHCVNNKIRVNAFQRMMNRSTNNHDNDNTNNNKNYNTKLKMTTTTAAAVSRSNTHRRNKVELSIKNKNTIVTYQHRMHLNMDGTVSLYIATTPKPTICKREEVSINSDSSVIFFPYEDLTTIGKRNTSHITPNATPHTTSNSFSNGRHRTTKTDEYSVQNMESFTKDVGTFSWSAVVCVKTGGDDGSTINLCVSSSVPSYDTKSVNKNNDTSTQYKTNCTDDSVSFCSTNFVQQPSRFSGPVLKSILQKLIRRRRPMPAVRVAMELIGPVVGILLRRLTIIVLEDSTLHPDYDFLVWLMIAHSKGYNVSHDQRIRILQIIYEIAACPWQDFYSDDYEPTLSTRLKAKTFTGKTEISEVTTLARLCSFLQHFHMASTGTTAEHMKNVLLFLPKQSTDSAATTTVSCNYDDKTDSTTTTNTNKMSRENSIHEDKFECCYSNGEIEVHRELRWVYTILVRAQYGGMHCDVKMLRMTANIWYRRFFITTTNTSTSIANPQNGPYTVNHWCEVPFVAYKHTMKQSVARVMLTTTNIQRLSITDIAIEGVDYHCTPIVEHLLKDPNVGNNIIKIINSRKHEQPKLLLDQHDNGSILYLEGDKTNSILLKTTMSCNSSTTDCNSNIALDSTKSCVDEIILKNGRLPDLESIIKQCIWKFSSSINYRSPLNVLHHSLSISHISDECNTNNINCTTANNDKDVAYVPVKPMDEKISNNDQNIEDDVLRTIWNNVLISRVVLYQSNYIQKRLR